MRQLQTKPLISCTKVDLFYMRGVYSMGHVLAYFCHDKHVFVVTKLCLFCHNKIMFVVTKLVATRRFLSPQKTFFVITNVFVATKVCLSWWKVYLWQLPPMIVHCAHQPLGPPLSIIIGYVLHLSQWVFAKRRTTYISVWIKATHCQSCKNPCQYTDIHFYSKDTNIHALSIQSFFSVIMTKLYKKKRKKYICFSTDASLWNTHSIPHKWKLR